MIGKFPLKSSEFTKSTLTLVIGTAIAQSIPFILQPFLRRIYTPEDFGAISIFLSMLAVISIISSFRYEVAILLPKEDEDAANIFFLSVLINLAFAVFGWTILYFFLDTIVLLINFPSKYSHFLYLLPLASMIFSIYQSVNYWLIRQKAFQASTKNKIVRRGVEGGVQVSLGLLQIPGGLFWGDLIGNLANALVGWKQMLKNSFKLSYISKANLRKVAVRYKEFPLFNVGPTFLSSMANILPFLLINKYFSTETVGYLDLTRLVLSIPLVFISAAITQVMFQQITEKKNENKSISSILRNVLFILLVIVILEFGIILPFGPSLFGFVFGSNYALSGQFAQLLLFSFVFNFFSSTFSCVLISLDKIRLNAVWQVLYFFGICSLYYFNEVDIDTFLNVFVLIDSGFQLLYCTLIFYIVRQYENKILS
jgi:O-antigen/teichoic acid export membrane protein